MNNHLEDIINSSNGLINEYSSIILDRVKYNIGDYVHIVNHEDALYPFSARIDKIRTVPFEGDKKTAAIQISW